MMFILVIVIAILMYILLFGYGPYLAFRKLCEDTISTAIKSVLFIHALILVFAILVCVIMVILANAGLVRGIDGGFLT